MDDLFQMARLVVLSPWCYYVATDFLFGNPYVENGNNYHLDCRICLYCCKDSILPSLNRADVEEVVLNVFYPDRDDKTFVDDIGPWTLDALLADIRNYTNIRYLLLKSNAKSDLGPSDIKKVVFILLVAVIMKINYHHVIKVEIFGMAQKYPGVP